MSLGRG